MPRKGAYKGLLTAGTIGMNLVVATFIGLAIGYGLDAYFRTKPWLTLVFLLLGIISGFREIFRIAKRQSDDSDT